MRHDDDEDNYEKNDDISSSPRVMGYEHDDVIATGSISRHRRRRRRRHDDDHDHDDDDDHDHQHEEQAEAEQAEAEGAGGGGGGGGGGDVSERPYLIWTIRSVGSADIEEENVVDTLTTLINDAYRIGELGIIVDSPEEPFQRVRRDDVMTMMTSRELLVLTLQKQSPTASASASQPQQQHAVTSRTNQVVVGCVKVQVLEEDDHDDHDHDHGVDKKGFEEGAETTIPPIPRTGRAMTMTTTTRRRIGEWGCLAVAPSHQGRGFGRRLVEAAERHLRQERGCSVLRLELLTPTHWRHDHKERLRDWYTNRMGYRLRFPDDYDASTFRLSQGALLIGRFRLAADADFTTYQKMDLDPL